LDPRTTSIPAFDGRVPPPDFVSIETTKFCNLRCRMCVQFNDGTTVAGPHMPIEEFERIAQQVFPFVERWQPSVSGEPMMSQQFDRMIGLAEAFGVKAEVFTNGTMLSDGRIALLAPNLGALTVSFDGATKDTFEFIREGAAFEEVKARLRQLIQYCRTHLRAAEQPQFGLNCTLMERNVRELPDLVRLAATELGVDFLSCYHVFPVTAEMRQQSLVHHREVALASIEQACAVARELGFSLRIDALDQITAATATAGGTLRAYATRDGVVEGFEFREVNPDRRRPWPKRGESGVAEAAVAERRTAAAGNASFPQPQPSAVPAPGLAGMPWCEFLWHKTYVAIGGDVRPCCVHGSPVVGNLLHESFEAVWNGEAYRQMRQRLVRGDPAPVCRGCTHIRTITDPVQAARHLLGARLPTAGEVGPLPAALDPQRARRQRAGAPPVLTWAVLPDAQRYVVEFSLDGFQSVLFSTDGPQGGPKIRQNRYEVPAWAWRDAPTDRAIQWRVWAKTAAGDRLCAEGTLAAEPAAVP
jgi:MoaA/NifB/PqqE/SkfB family radical SAM enzyme